MIWSLEVDLTGKLWIGTPKGLCEYIPQTDNFKRYFTKEDANSQRLEIYDIYADNTGNLWLGCGGSGLVKFNPQTKQTKVYKQSDGLASNGINSISADNKGVLWLGSGNGISRFDPQNEQVKNFDINNGLQGNQFNIGANLKLSTGEIIIGGTNGFNVFNPDSILGNIYIPPIQFTGFKIFNSPVDLYSKNSPLSKNISFTDTLFLDYSKSVFSIDFAALDYTASEKNQYQYMMSGFDNQWNEVSNKHEATYTNLDPGEYTFLVKASNNDGLWNESAKKLTIIILPPWWKTWWFKTLATLSITSLALGFYFYRIGEINRQKIQLEHIVLKRTQELEIANSELHERQELIQQKNDVLETQTNEIKLQAQQLADTNTLLQEQNEAIQIQAKELTHQKKNIVDSIEYAKHLQRALLPPLELIKSLLPQHMLIYQPRDIVSGDFYWLNTMDNVLFLSVADCTGHGVPGALMSILGISLLNEAMNIFGSEEIEPAMFLNFMRKELIKSMRHNDQKSVLQDGLDIVLCRINFKKMELQYAGANHPLVIIRNGELIKYDADRMPIGVHINENNSFSNQTIQLQKLDRVFMFSDGFQDQFGGDNHRKYMTVRFYELLRKTSIYTIEEQKQQLIKEFEQWKGTNSQIDDVLILGFVV